MSPALIKIPGLRGTGRGVRHRSGGAADLSWVDGFIDNIRPYVRVREADAVLIKMPNQAYHLNPAGVRVLSYLLAGNPAAGLLREVGFDKAADIALFLDAVKRCLEGTLSDCDCSPAVTSRPLAVNFSELPVLSEVALTGRCNLKCVFCYAGCSCRGAGGKHRKEMKRGDVRLVIDRIFHDAGVPSVSFTGGEPALRRELPELVAYAAGKGMRVNLITNGTLMTPRLAQSLAGAGLASAQVSIEGSTATTHERVTGVPGSFARSITAIEHLRAAGVHVHANTTINRYNFDECATMPEFTAGLGLDRFSMNLVIPSGSAAVNTGALVRYSEVAPLLEEIIAASECEGVEFMWYSPTPLCIFNPVARGLGNKGCSACDGLLSVDPAGNILPCSSWDEPVGNLIHEGFQSLWGNSAARTHRMKSLAHPGCHRCDSFAACHGACPLYWRHFGFGELEKVKGFTAREMPAEELGSVATGAALTAEPDRGPR